MRIITNGSHRSNPDLPCVEMTSRDIRIVDEALALYQRNLDDLHMTDTIIGSSEHRDAQKVREGLESISVTIGLYEENRRKEEPAHV